MANVDAAFGAIPVRHMNGSPYNGQVERMYVPSTDATAIFQGDFVKLAGSADADGVPSVAQAAAGDAIVGVVVGFEPNRDDLSLMYRKASTERYLLVCTAPDVIFEIQEDSDGGALAAADTGNNVDVVVGTGSTTTGRSAMEIDSSSKVTTTAQLRLIARRNNPDDEFAANAVWEVMINEHERKATTGV